MPSGNWSDSDPCFLPPGREWAILHCLPVVPRPQWERYVQRGTFPHGIQKGLDGTADCLLNEAVVVDGAVISGAGLPYGPIAGVFPPGWYRGPCSEGEPPPDPEETVARLESRPLDAFTLDRLTLDRGDAPTLGPLGCTVRAVPTLDLLVPWPVNRGYVRVWRRTEAMLPGDLGFVVVRVPGSDHPLFSTGIGLVFYDRSFLSPLGVEVFDFMDAARQGWHDPNDHRYEERCDPFKLFGGRMGGISADRGDLDPNWWTRDYQASHMQCLPRNHDAAGNLVQYRWQVGGERPAPYVGQGYDAYGELYPPKTAFGYHMPTGLRADGTSHLDYIPERLGLRAQWQGRTRIPRDWEGPPPGAFLVESDPSLDDDAATEPLPTLGGYGRSATMGGFFDEIVDVMKAPFEFTADVVGEVTEFQKDLLVDVWEHLPKEVRSIAMQVGPMVAQAYLPGFGGTAAKAAIAVLEGGRLRERARKAMRRAQQEGQIPSWLDLNDQTHLAALARADEAPARAAAPVAAGAGEASFAPVAAAGAGLAALALL